MPTGRCAGCGHTDSSAKARAHVLTCADYLTLFRQQPERCLEPAAEYVRFKRDEDNREARAERHGQRVAERMAEMEALQRRAAARWATPKDILDD